MHIRPGFACKWLANFQPHLMNTSAYLTLDTRYKKQDGSYPIVLRVVHNRKMIDIKAGYSVSEEYWDNNRCKIKNGYPSLTNIARVNSILASKSVAANDTISKLEDEGTLSPYSVGQLKDLILKVLDPDADKKDEVEAPKIPTVFEFAESLIQEQRTRNSIGNAMVYKNVLREIRNFTMKADFTFAALDYKWLIKFDTYYTAKGGQTNGLSLYMRTIRAWYNRAVKEKIVPKGESPFDDYKIKSAETPKRAIALDAIGRIVALQVEESDPLFLVRNMFLLSYSSWGMPFVDLAFLKLSNIVDGRIQYGRHKTGKPMSIKIEETADAIIKLYSSGKSKDEFLFPIIKRAVYSDQYKDMLWARKRYNDGLKELGKMAGIEENMSSYVSRHSFASAADNEEVPLTAISAMLGHTRLSTTQVYLAGLPNRKIDGYNKRVLITKTN